MIFKRNKFNIKNIYSFSLISICLLIYFLLLNFISNNHFINKFFFELIMTLTFLPLIFVLLNIINGNHKVLSPLTAFSTLFMVFVYIGSTIHFYFPNLQHTSSYQKSENSNYILFYLVNFSFLFVILGGLLANVLHKFNPKKEILNYQNKRIIDNLSGIIYNPAVILIVILATIGCIITIVKTGSIPLFDMFSNMYDSVEITEKRTEFSSNAKYFVVFTNILFPVITTTFSIKYLSNKQNRFYKIITFGFTIAAIFFALMSSHRGYLLELFWIFLIIYFYTSKKVNLFKIFNFILLILALFIMLTIVKFASNPVYVGSNPLLFGSYLLVERFFFTQIDSLIFICENFPNIYAFQHGVTLLNDLSALLPGPQYAFSNWLHDHISPKYMSGNAPTTFIGDIYANFGSYCTYLICFITGYISQLSYINFIRSSKTVLNILIMILFSVFISKYATIGLASGFVTRGIYYLIFIIAIIIMQSLLLQSNLLRNGKSNVKEKKSI